MRFSPVSAITLISRFSYQQIFITLLIAGLLSLAIAARIFDLETLPGLNGDEAWYGIQAQHLLAGSRAEWMNHSGHWITPFHQGGVIVSEALIGQPSLLGLRLPALVFGLLAMIIAFIGFRNTLGWSSATQYALLLATLPILIIYSRFGWEPSVIPLFAVGFFVALWQRRLFLGALLLGAACWTHMSGLFLLPIGLAVLLSPWLLRQPNLTRYGIIGFTLLLTVLAITILAPLGHDFIPELFPTQSEMIGRWLNLSAWKVVWLGMGSSLSGLLSNQDIATPIATNSVRNISVVASTVLSVSGTLVVINSWKNADGLWFGLCIGTLLSWIALYGLVGDTPSRVGFDRYQLFLSVPLMLILARAITLIGQQFASNTVPWLIVLFISVAQLTLFNQYYWQPLQTSGDRGVAAFHRSKTDPKLMAVNLIRKNTGEGKTVIFADSYWVELPMRYFLGSQSPISVQRLNQKMVFGEDVKNIYLVGFNGDWFATHQPLTFPGYRLQKQWWIKSRDRQRNILAVWKYAKL